MRSRRVTPQFTCRCENRSRKTPFSVVQVCSDEILKHIAVAAAMFSQHHCVSDTVLRTFPSVDELFKQLRSWSRTVLAFRLIFCLSLFEFEQANVLFISVFLFGQGMIAFHPMRLFGVFTSILYVKYVLKHR